MAPLKVAVIIPAYHEESLIKKTLEGIPDFVHEIIVVDDASADGTFNTALEVDDSRVKVLSHKTNRGVGAAIYTGYFEALKGASDAFVVMAGDNQMDPADLKALLKPLEQGDADYVKGNRLRHSMVHDMPLLRRWGTRLLAVFTSWAAGTHLEDTQCGFTAITRKASQLLPYSDLWPRFGYPNDLLICLIRRGARITEVNVRPVYADEKSGLHFWHLLFVSGVIFRRWYLESSLRSSKRQVSPLA